MNGVDQSDQTCTLYSTARRSRKWWTYLFWFLINICISNANILINESPNHQLLTKTGAPRKRSMLEFRKQLTYELINNYRDGRKRGRTVEPDIHGGGHYPKHAGKKQRCTYCKLINRKPRVRESIFVCKGCRTFRDRLSFICAQKSASKSTTLEEILARTDTGTRRQNASNCNLYFVLYLTEVFLSRNPVKKHVKSFKTVTACFALQFSLQ